MYDVVIVTYNSEKWLRKCLLSLSQIEYQQENLNLIFVDNQSTDNTIQLLQKYKSEYSCFAGFSIFPQNKNGGFSVGCNIGASKGNAPYIFFLNADTEVDLLLFKQLDATIQNSSSTVGAFECRQLPYETGHHINPVTLETTWASGAALVVLREAFTQIGGFDENLFMYCEDVDLSWRLRAAGYAIKYVPKAEVTHHAYSGDKTPDMKLGEYTGGFYGNLLLRYKFGSISEILQGHRMYLGALRQPLHFPNVRKVLLKNYAKHFFEFWPFLFWRLKNKKVFHTKTAQFSGGFSPDRGLFFVKKPDEQPLVSVVVRTCGRPAMLRDTLQSLVNQTYSNFEVIVIEDGEPKSQKLLETEFSNLQLRYISTQEKVGRSRAGNIGLENASGEYCNFLDDDDYFYPDHLELLVAQATTHKNADLVTAASMAMEADVISMEPYQLQVGAIYPMRFERLDLFKLCQQCLMPIQSILFKRALFIKKGGLNESLDGDEDWSMWLRYFSVAKRINKRSVDIPRATSLFVVPMDKQKGMKREYEYEKYENKMLDDPTITFTVTPREMRQYYNDFIADIQHLQQLGQLEDFLQKHQEKAEREKKWHQ